ncbi:RraA family protein [Priestia sp. FSL R5-0597]|uniref:RraA family protein n=1 Tax=Priestia TaxID=2800373 RepID=UPI0012B7266E|nr:RraA family protein [Priestia megaterium]
MYQIASNSNSVSKELIEEYRKIGTTIIADALGRFHTMQGICHFNHSEVKLVGRALTIRTIAGDNLMIHKALDYIEPGDVIVVEGEGHTERALLGDLLCQMAKKRRLEGFVVDGSIRDAVTIKEMNFPVFAKGKNPAGPFKEGPGEINVQISCAGVSVNPGDLIVGDDDGVVVVPKDKVVEVLERAKSILEYEENTVTQIENGTLDRSWIDKKLEARGIKVEF